MSTNQETTETQAARLRRAVRRLARELNDSSTGEGLSPSQASALGTVVARGPIGLRELTDVERVNPTMLSRVIGTLEAAAYVRRFPSESDQRAVMVESTPEGRIVNDRIRSQRTEQLLTSIAQLSEEHAHALSNAVEALEALVERVAEQHR